MSRVELLQRAARVLHVTQVNWNGAMSLCGAGRSRAVAFIDTADTGVRSAPRLVSSRIRARIRLDRVALSLSTLLIR